MKKINNNIPRGIRNNNPLNIERSKSKWQGLAEHQRDPRFAQFKSMTWGIRAAFKTLQSYRTKHGCNSLRQFMPSPRSSESLWCSIVDSMIRVECGRPVDKKTIHDAWHKAFVEI